MKKLLLIICLLFYGSVSYASSWVNDTKTLFQSNRAVVLTVNLRNFAAVDNDMNGIIQTDRGDIKGDFINSISRLDELSKMGINTMHILPINPVGIKHAYGSAGSLFAVKDFTSISSDFKCPSSSLTIELQFKTFIDACHKRNIHVLVELPAYASYDLYLKKPGFFLKNSNRNSIIPNNSKDLRVLNAGTNFNINSAVYSMYKKYIDLLLALDVDGVVVQNPASKPAKFWYNLISSAKNQNNQFVFIAEMSPSEHKSVAKGLPFVSLHRVLNSGFDGFYSSFNSIQEWKFADDLLKQLSINHRYSGKQPEQKFVIGSFASYNDISPILVNDTYLSKMMIWLNATLPLNPMYLDGFQFGDDYSFPWANLRAYDTRTDDDVYFVNRGKFDLYNFSRRPVGSHKDITNEFIKANKFKSYIYDNLPNGKFTPLKTNDKKVFAYAISDLTTNYTIFVVGNFDLDNIHNVEIKVPKITQKFAVDIIRTIAVPQLNRNKIYTVIAPADIQIFMVKGFSIK